MTIVNPGVGLARTPSPYARVRLKHPTCRPQLPTERGTPSATATVGSPDAAPWPLPHRLAARSSATPEGETVVKCAPFSKSKECCCGKGGINEQETHVKACGLVSRIRAYRRSLERKRPAVGADREQRRYREATCRC